MSTKQKISLHLIGFLIVLSVTISAVAQQPASSPTPAAKTDGDAPTPVGEKAGDYTAIGSVEFGYRGLSVDGDHNKYQSDLNYKAGPRLFDSSFLLRSSNGKGSLFETFLVNSTGWGADPQGNLRVTVEQPEWYRFDATYRRFKYFRFVNSFANPNWVFSPATFSVPPKLTSGEHGTDTGLARARVERLAVLAALVWGGDVRYGTGGTWAGRSIGSLRLQPRRTLARYRSPRLDRSDPAASRGRGGIRERLEREGTANARRMGAATGKRAERKTCRYDWVTN